MREELAKLGNRRAKFRGTFSRYGVKSGWMGRTEKTALLRNITDSRGRLVADHLWFNWTKGFAQLSLDPGDVIEFNARVRPYWKGYKGSRVGDRPPLEMDYRLSHPNHFRCLRIEQRKAEDAESRKTEQMVLEVIE